MADLAHSNNQLKERIEGMMKDDSDEVFRAQYKRLVDANAELTRNEKIQEYKLE